MPFNFSNERLTASSRRLRKEMTAEERKLWHLCLKTLPYRFRRQKVIENYIVDFYCANIKTAIEIDGSQHYEETNAKNDEKRTEYLNSLGITVLRYSNYEINVMFDSVRTDIYHKLGLIKES